MRLRRSTLAFFCLALAVIGAALVTNVLPYNQIMDQRRDVVAARADLADLESENSVLAAQRDSLQTDVEIERLAREKLGYVRPGEIAYVVLEPPEMPVPVTEPTEDPAPEVVDDTSLLESVWDFVTGADLDG